MEKQIQIIQQINMLTSSFIEQNKEDSISLISYIQNHYISKQKYLKKDNNFYHLMRRLNVIMSYDVCNIPINQISENSIIKLLSEIKSDRKIKDSTLNRYRSILHHIFNCAYKEQKVIANPVSKIKRHKEQSRNRIISSHKIYLFLSKCLESRNQELFIIVLVALYTGMRFSNIINMRKSRIIDKKYYLPASENKSRKDLQIPLNDDLLKILSKFISSNPNGDKIFKSKSIRTCFRNALMKANIEDFRFHDLRRVFATTLLNNGTEIKTIQELLGHSTLTVTEVYLATNDEKKLDAVNKLCFIN